MFYKNTTTPIKVKNLKIKLDSLEENPKPIKETSAKNEKTPQISYNFKLSNGVLEDGYGFKDLTIPYRDTDMTEHYVDPGVDDIISVWDFHWYDSYHNNTNTFIFYMDSSFNVKFFYEYKYQDIIREVEASFTSKPETFEYRFADGNRIILSSPTDDLAVCNGASTFTYENSPHIASSCVHENCFYGILSDDDSKLIYRDKLVHADWDISKFEELVFSGGEGGRLRKLFSFNDYIYLFRENGIVKIYPFSTKSPLSITHIYYSSSLIIPQSIQRCGEKILFLTREGLHTFDGSTVKKLNLDIVSLVDMSSYTKFASACQKGKYYLACKMDFSDEDIVGCEGSELGYNNNAILIYDVDSEKVEIMRGVDVCDFAPIESNIMSKLLCCFYNDYKKHLAEMTEDGQVFGEIMPKKWTSTESDFGFRDNKKIVKSISLYALKDCQVEIKSDKESKVYDITGKSEKQKIKTNVKGKNFQFSFISKVSGQKISSIEIDVDVLL